MASTGSISDPAIAPVLQALDALYSNSDRQTKEHVGQYLEQFQKSSEAWSTSHSILTSNALPLQAKVFAAQTLRSKVLYDLHQLSTDAQLQLRTSLLSLLNTYKAGPKLILVQVALSLANLAIQLVQWHDAVADVVGACGNDISSAPIVLEFLKVLPEEASDVRKIPLSDEELKIRTGELLERNALQVLNILITYVQSSQTPSSAHSLIFECLNSWMREVPLSTIVNSPLLDIIFQALDNDDLFDSATDCVCSMLRETRDVDESTDVIPALYSKVMGLRPHIQRYRDDPEAFRNYCRIFADAGEAWHMLIAREPRKFRPLAEAILECTAFEEDLEVVQFTFYFWYLLKQMLELSRYEEARRDLKDIYLTLVEVMIKHLHYPYESKNGSLFGNDREQEDKFRAFRHEMGDVLKDCCAVVGPTSALRKAYVIVEEVLNRERAGEKIPWQDIEAPIFSMRTMAREVDLDDTGVLPDIMNLLVQLPDHNKIRYAVTLVLGRYTEWTAKHPEFMEFELNYIIGGFQKHDEQISSAASQSMMYFCRDCAIHLVGFIDQIRTFYEQVAPEVSLESLYDLTDGVAHLVAALPLDKMYEYLKTLCAPIVERLYAKANAPADDAGLRKIADEIELLDTFARLVAPEVTPSKSHPCMQFWQEAWPLINALLENHGQSTYVAERSCKLIRTLVFSYRSHFFPLLGPVAEKLVACFDKYHYGAYLWASGVCVREFGAEYSSVTDANTQNAIWEFAKTQAISTFKYMSTVNIADIPDVVEDLFRLLSNLATSVTYRFIQSELFRPSVEAVIAVFLTENKETIFTAVDLLNDILAFGFSTPPPAAFAANSMEDEPKPVPPEIQEAVKQLVLAYGERLTKIIISGLLYSFPRECVGDCTSVELVVLKLGGAANAVSWVNTTLSLLPAGSITEAEKQKYVLTVESSINDEDMSRLRRQTMDFVGWFTRRNITPRSGVSAARDALRTLGDGKIVV
ncbi:armadillo-type protein [Lipomyces japonicus]|uniref:armadillo-type protein n=1 Tax=Lipomyces japonicus TaxID=56871 RepID=UPI0034CE52F3